MRSQARSRGPPGARLSGFGGKRDTGPGRRAPGGGTGDKAKGFARPPTGDPTALGRPNPTGRPDARTPHPRAWAGSAGASGAGRGGAGYGWGREKLPGPREVGGGEGGHAAKAPRAWRWEGSSQAGTLLRRSEEELKPRKEA